MTWNGDENAACSQVFPGSGKGTGDRVVASFVPVDEACAVTDVVELDVAVVAVASSSGALMVTGTLSAGCVQTAAHWDIVAHKSL